MSARKLAWGIWAAAQLSALAGLGLLVASWDAPVPDSWGFRGFTALFAFAFATLGALIVSRRQSGIGWILLGAGLGGGLQALAGEYAAYGLLGRPDPLPGAVFFAWFGSWIWLAMVTLIAIYLPLLFPDGRLPSRRWAIVAVGAGLMAGGFMVGLATVRDQLYNAPYVRNPFGILPLTNEQLITFFSPAIVLLAVLAAGSLVLRYRRARGAEREQIKWLGYGAAVVVAGLTVNVVFLEHKSAQYALIASMLAIPISVAVAILRYRLYDIDVLINRTLVYGALTASLLATYFAVVVLFQSLLRPFTAGNELAVAGSTLATLALVQPLRRRIQDAVDRRFYRSRYDSARTLDAFSARLRDEVDLDAVRADLLGAVRDTVQPAHATVWLRARAR